MDTPPTAISVDVEGSEFQVLQGAARTLKVAHPKIWLSVHSDERWMAEQYPGEGLDAITEYLAGFGYVGERLADAHEEHWLWL